MDDMQRTHDLDNAGEYIVCAHARERRGADCYHRSIAEDFWHSLCNVNGVTQCFDQGGRGTLFLVKVCHLQLHTLQAAGENGNGTVCERDGVLGPPVCNAQNERGAGDAINGTSSLQDKKRRTTEFAMATEYPGSASRTASFAKQKAPPRRIHGASAPSPQPARRTDCGLTKLLHATLARCR